MATSLFPFREPSVASDMPLRPAQLLVLLIMSLGALLWGTILITGQQGTSFQSYILLLGLYGAASAAFIFFRLHKSRLSIFGIPVFVTILVFTRFGLVPLYSFANPEDLNRNFLGRYDLLVRGLLYIALGMLAFWLGSACFSRKKHAHLGLAPGYASARTKEPPDLVLPITAGLYGVVFATKLYLLHAHLLSYTMSWRAYHSNLASLQVLGVVASLGSCALIVLAIERYSHPSDSKRKFLFVWVFLSECGWGLISGDKHLLLENFFLVAVVASIVDRKIRAGWLLAPFLGLVLFYPLSNVYRTLLRRNGGATSVSAATNLGSQAFSQAADEYGGLNAWVDSGWRASLSRLDILQSFALVLELGPRAAVLRGNERWWMIPYYPFIPRFIWSSKPVLDKGMEFSLATGSTATSSMAVTYPGDLYATYGVPGIILGMFLLGIITQLLTNSVSGAFDKRHLFLYVSIFSAVTNLEIDSFSFWTTLIKTFVILSAVSLVIYGPRPRTARVRTAGKRPVTEPCES